MPPNQVIAILRQHATQARSEQAKLMWTDMADTVQQLHDGWDRTPFIPVQIDWRGLLTDEEPA